MQENINKEESNHEIIDIEIYTNEGKEPPLGKHYKVKIDGKYYIFHHHIVTGKELLEKAGKIPVECHSLYQKLKNCDFNKISLDEKVDLIKPGVEHFVVKPPEVFYYTVDDEPETTEHKSLTADKILELAGLKPVDYYLVLVHSDGKQHSYKDTPHAEIKMKCPGLKFISVFRGEVPVSFKN
jgi:hypothetical protein